MRSVREPDACRECQEAIASCHKAAVIGGEEPGHGSRFVRAAQTAISLSLLMSGCHRLPFSAACRDPFLARLRTQNQGRFQFVFRLKPIVYLAAWLCAAFEIDFVCATPDLLVTRRAPN